LIKSAESKRARKGDQAMTWWRGNEIKEKRKRAGEIKNVKIKECDTKRLRERKILHM
jgi:hypothetical protein